MAAEISAITIVLKVAVERETDVMVIKEFAI
jgi:hypothetical protein